MKSKSNSHVKEHFCQLFYLDLSSSYYNHLKKEYSFEGAQLNKKFNSFEKFNEISSPKNELKNNIKIQIPIALITKDFINYAKNIFSKKINSVSKALNLYFEETGRIYTHNIDFGEGEFPPFMDIDTKNVYDKTTKIITSLIVEKK